ncbi:MULTISPECIES: YadA-like family protein [Acinetobacter]|nr:MULTISPECIES: YadA-like family protein [Acinetobacter]
MKFQKTLLAMSLAVFAVSTANAELVANPNVHSYKINGVEVSPQYAPKQLKSPTASITDTNNYYAPTLSHDIRPGNSAQTGETAYTDYGSGNVVNGNVNQIKSKSDLYLYTASNGETVYQFETHYADGRSTSEYYTRNGNDLIAYKGDVNALTNLRQGGQVEREDKNAISGNEIKRVNNEGVKYGYTDTVTGTSEFAYTTTDPNGQTTSDKLNHTGTLNANKKFVEVGIIGQTNHNDPSSNIYGMSARDGQNVVVSTGNGIALNTFDITNSEMLTDGSVIKRTVAQGSQTTATQKVRKYNSNGTEVYEVFGDNQPSKFYTNNAGNFTEFKGDTSNLVPTNLAAHTLTGTADTSTAVYNIKNERNTVTNKNVTYSEKDSIVNQTIANVSVTKANQGSGVADETFKATIANEPEKIKLEQSVQAGKLQNENNGEVRKNEDGSNLYGVEVVRKQEGKDVEKTTITSNGITTTGTINAKDYQINGVSIVDNIKTSVDGAVAGATEAIDKKVAQVDEKIVEVDKRLTEFNTTASNLNSRVDQLNGRIDDVEETAYRGIAIALAAQQAIPNIGAGQTAVFGGVGHYEGESAGALGVATVFADGRTSVSGALGVAGGGEVGGRVGVAYVFGGK